MISMSTSRGGEEASSLETPGERRCGRGPGEEWEEGEVKGKKGKKEERDQVENYSRVSCVHGLLKDMIKDRRTM
jgi:hypothetical protein